jgi:hypothetical protein
MSEKLLMQVEKSVDLTGLGVLLLPQYTTPLLASFELYTQWSVQLAFPDGNKIATVASAEEVFRPVELPGAAAVETRALLLTQEDVGVVPAGTLVYLLEPAASF